ARPMAIQIQKSGRIEPSPGHRMRVIKSSALASCHNFAQLLDHQSSPAFPFSVGAGRLMYQYVPVDELRALVGAATAAKGLAAASAIAVLRSIAVLLSHPTPWSGPTCHQR